MFSEREAEIAKWRAFRVERRAAISARRGEALKQIARLKLAVEIENRAAADEGRESRAAEMRTELATLAAALDDFAMQDRQLAARIAQLDAESAALVEECREELVGFARDLSAAAAEELHKAFGEAVPRALAAVARADAAWRKALDGYDGVERLRERVGSWPSNPQIPFGATRDLVELATQPIALGSQRTPRWQPIALARDLAAHLATVDALPQADLYTRDRGNGLPGAYEDRATLHAAPLGAHHMDGVRDQIEPDRLGFARWHRVRDLTAEEREHHRREQATAKPGQIIVEPGAGGAVEPDAPDPDTSEPWAMTLPQ